MKVPDELSSLTARRASEVMNQADIPSTSSSSTLGASPAIDRHNPIIQSDSRRNRIPSLAGIRSKSDSQHELITQPCKKQVDGALQKKENISDQKANSESNGKSVDFNFTNRSSSISTSSSDQTVFTPSESSRYLLSENIFSDSLQGLYPQLDAAKADNNKYQALEPDEKVSSPSSSLDSKLIFRTSDKSRLPSNKKSAQVVVLRVSLHCKGCAAKVRKHISRMEGVTSFNIDFTAKKVTVVGDVTPLEVLSTISKVKNAQLWTPETSKLARIPL